MGDDMRFTPNQAALRQARFGKGQEERYSSESSRRRYPAGAGDGVRARLSDTLTAWLTHANKQNGDQETAETPVGALPNPTATDHEDCDSKQETIKTDVAFVV